MKIKTRCDHCGKLYLMDSSYIGQTAQCKQCHNSFIMALFEEPQAAPQPYGVPVPGGSNSQQPYGAQNQGYPPQQPYGAQNQGYPPQQPYIASASGGYTPYGDPAAGFPPPPPYGNQAPGTESPMPFGDVGPTNRQPQFSGQPDPLGGYSPDTVNAPTQTVVCPKCRYTAQIPPMTGSMRLRCQQCGKSFMVKPEKKKTADKAPGEKKPAPKTAIIGLAVLLLVVAVLFVGPTLLPNIIPNLLPF